MTTVRCIHVNRYTIEIAPGYYIEICRMCARNIYSHIMKAQEFEKKNRDGGRG